MQLYHLFSFATIVAQAAVASKSTSPTKLNGWYACRDYTFSEQGSSDGRYSECATFSAPLCYPGVCKTPQFTDPTIDVFVKRMVATKGDPEKATNVWILQGGPGYSSSSLEQSMLDLYTQLDGAANIYTMDHRGTGRSTFLDCVAAQATTTGSPSGKELDPSEVGACAQSLENEYGSLASFSSTSAANDVVTFISKYTNGASTIVSGVSYGTVLVERIIHLAPPKVTGYVLDGIATTSGASTDKIPYMSMVDEDDGEVGDYFMELCMKDKNCSSHFKKPNTLASTLRSVIADFDNNPNSTCASLLKTSDDDQYPSINLRSQLSSMLVDDELRKFIPPFVYRLERCGKNDVEVVTQFTNTVAADAGAKSQDDAYYSPLLYYLIVFSEWWESPQPSMDVMEARFLNASIATGQYGTVPLYCAFSKEKSPTCDELKLGSYAASGILYKRDKYWNKSAKIPSQASVLLMSSKLDIQTPHKYAGYLLEALDGKNKELVTFESSIHGALMWTQLAPSDVWTPTCGVKILASYVTNKGSLKGLDKSCVDEMPVFNFTVEEGYRNSYFSTDDAYDGAFDASLSSTQPAAEGSA